MINTHTSERARSFQLYRAAIRQEQSRLYPKRKDADLTDDERDRVRKAAVEAWRPLLNRAARRAHGERGYGHGLGSMSPSVRTKR